VLDHGGEVLKFVGDSVLAIFAIDDPNQKKPKACARALAAAVEASQRFEAVNKDRAAAGDRQLERIVQPRETGESFTKNRWVLTSLS
jgi:adenylate cyclase